MSTVSLQQAGMVILLVVETELLALTHPDARTAARDWLSFPAYHLMLVFLASAALVRLLYGSRLPQLPSARVSGLFLALHVGLAGVLAVWLSPLTRFIVRTPGGPWLWLPLFALYLLSWLAAWIPPRQWPELLRQHLPWLGACLAASALCLAATWSSLELWRPLASGTFWLTRQLLLPWFPELVARPEELVVGTPSFLIRILPPCSGYEGMGLMVSFLLIYFWVRRQELRFPQALVLLPLGVAAMWLANCFRLATLIAIGTLISPRLAVGGFHSQAGWISFSVLGVLGVLAVERLHWFQRTPGDFSYPAAPYLMPVLTLLGTDMLSRAFSISFDRFYPLRAVAVALVLLTYRRSYAGLLGMPGARAAALGAGVFMLWVGLVSAPPHPGRSPLEALGAEAGCVWLLFRVVGSVLVIPLAEELAFRGYLLRRLQSSRFEDVPPGRVTLPSLLLSSLAFGLLHAEWLAGTLAGMAYAWAFHWRGRLSDAVLAHATTNLCLTAQVLLSAEWGRWSL